MTFRIIDSSTLTVARGLLSSLYENRKRSHLVFSSHGILFGRLFIIRLKKSQFSVPGKKFNPDTLAREDRWQFFLLSHSFFIAKSYFHTHIRETQPWEDLIGMYRFNSTTCARTCVTNQPTIPPVGLSVLPCLVQSAAGLVRWSAPRMRKTASMHTCVLQKEGNKPGSKVNIRFFPSNSLDERDMRYVPQISLFLKPIHVRRNVGCIANIYIYKLHIFLIENVNYMCVRL